MKKLLQVSYIILMLIASINVNGQSTFPILPGSTLADGNDNQILRTWLENVGAVPSGTLLYRRSTNGASASAFHAKVDNQGPTLILFKTNAGTVFGGFSTGSWGSTSNYASSTEAFLFNLNTNQRGSIYYPQHSIYTNSYYGPTFGGGHDIHIDNSMNSGYFNVHSYNSVDGSGYQSSTALKALTGINTTSTYYNFGAGFITEIEAYKIEFNTSAPIIKGQNITVSLNANGEAGITPQDIDAGTTDPDGEVTLSINVNSFNCSNLGGNSQAITPTSVGSASQNPHSVGGGYNPLTKEFWYPEWSGTTVYRYDENRNFLGTFNSGQSQMMQLWMDAQSQDYYTANWSYRTATRRNGSSTVWTYNANNEVAGITTDNTYAYLLLHNSTFMTVLDKASGAFVKNINLPGNLYSVGGMVQSNGKLYITGYAQDWAQINHTYGAVHVYDIATQTYEYSFNPGLQTVYGVAFTGETIWFSDTNYTSYGFKVSEGNSYGSSGSGANAVTLTATDPLGNTRSQSFSVTVQDTIAPTIALNGSTAINIKQGAAFADQGATITDNCSAKLVITGSVDINTIGTYTLSYKAVDGSKNQSATVTRTVKVGPIDDISPIVRTKNITVSLGENGTVEITPAQVDNGSTDNIGITALSLDKTSFDCSNLGPNTVVLTATDSTNNVSNKSATVTVVDSIAPAKPILADVIGECTAKALTVPTTTDNCAGTIAGTTTDSLTYTTQGTHVITWSFNDGNGNISTATQNVIIKDITAPVAPVLADVIAECSATLSVPSTTDNCAGVITGTTSDALTYTAQGSYVITWSFNDGNGNVTTATQNVLIKDLTAPAALTKNISVTLVNGSATITAASVDNGSNDACGIQSLSIDRSVFDCSNLGNNTVVLTVTDKNGNVSSASAVVNVIGVKPVPSIAESRSDNTFTGLDSKTIALGYGAQKLTLTASNSTSASNASTYVWSPATGLSNATIANPVFTPTAAGTYTFNVIATNEFGCSASTSITINVIDVRSGNKGDKVLVCHKAGNNKWTQISIGASAVNTHLLNGGYLGACNTPATIAAAPSGDLTLANNPTLGNTNILSAYPNPFAGQTRVFFKLVADQANVSLDLYDLKGVKVKNVYSGSANALQAYSFNFDGSSIPSGVYFFKLTGNNLNLNFKVIVTQ